MKFPRLFDGEMYVSAAQRRMREKKAAREKNVGEKPFVPPSPSKKMTSAGTLSGTFTKKIEYIPRPEVAADRKGAHGQKQILTNPAKKGHYNTPGILMSKQAYMPADYGSFQKQEAERRRQCKPLSFLVPCDTLLPFCAAQIGKKLTRKRQTTRKIRTRRDGRLQVFLTPRQTKIMQYTFAMRSA